MIASYLEKCIGRTSPSDEETLQVFEWMLDGKLTEGQVGACLVAWRTQGVSKGLLTSGAQAMRLRASKPNILFREYAILDNCGTGGDGSSSFNISTAAAIVASACGLKIAKHGNRSVSSQCGSADLLFAAGFPEDLGLEGATELLQETGFTFFFAPSFHPAMRHVMSVRRSLGIPTVFNLLGPLANPISPEYQLIGVGKPEFLEPVAESIAALGVLGALVVHSRDGLDEISPESPTDAIRVLNGTTKRLVIHPKDMGISGATKDLVGGAPVQNLSILKDLLQGKKGAVHDAVTLNAGAALWIAGQASDLAQGTTLASAQLTEGKVADFFQQWLEKARLIAVKFGKGQP